MPELGGQNLDLDELVREHADYLFQYALRHFPQKDTAQELVQETLLAAIESAENFRGEAAPRTWLTSILRFKIIDQIRRQTRDKVLSGVESTEHLDPDNYYFDENEHWRTQTGPLPWQLDPENFASQKQFMRKLDGCLQKLPPRHRQAFLLKEVDDVDSEKLCNDLELSATNLRVLLCRSRVMLRECLDKQWFRPAKTHREASP